MKFLVDAMLGKLAKELRMLGYDTVCCRSDHPREIIDLARQQERVVVTRNTRVFAKRSEDRVIHIRKDKPLLQLKELLAREMITLNREALFSRCLLCNCPLDRIAREMAEGKVPDYIFYHHETFYQCSHCSRIYWPGSHQERMQKRLTNALCGSSVER